MSGYGIIVQQRIESIVIILEITSPRKERREPQWCRQKQKSSPSWIEHESPWKRATRHRPSRLITSTMRKLNLPINNVIQLRNFSFPYRFSYEEPYEAHHHPTYHHTSHVDSYSHAIHRAPSYRYEAPPAPEYSHHAYHHHPRDSYPAGNNSNIQNTFYQNTKTHAYKNNNNNNNNSYKNHWLSSSIGGDRLLLREPESAQK